MGKKLGIYVNSDRHFQHLLGITRAAVQKGIAVNLFFTYSGVRLTKDPDFKTLADIVAGNGKMALCLHSWKQFEMGETYSVPGIDEKDFATQVRHAELLDEVDRYLVL